MSDKPMSDKFSNFSSFASDVLGHPSTFALALGTIIVWAITGPMFNYSDTWQLVINTGTSIITYLMVFMIQNTQNRNGDALQMKIDELICATKTAHDSILDLENLSEEDINAYKEKYRLLAEKARAVMDLGKIKNPSR